MKNYVIGVDMGTTATKAVIVSKGAVIASVFNSGSNRRNLEQAVAGVLGRGRINLADVERIMLTGVGGSFVREREVDGIPLSVTDEFNAMACGVRTETGTRDAVIVSMGTGTALVKLESGKASHIGGSGIGGGTLVGLSSLMADVTDMDDIFSLAPGGDISKVDLQVGDILHGSFSFPVLPRHATAANFGKISPDAG
jgi:type II pantothenate kinase